MDEIGVIVDGIDFDELIDQFENDSVEQTVDLRSNSSTNFLNNSGKPNY